MTILLGPPKAWESLSVETRTRWETDHGLELPPISVEVPARHPSTKAEHEEYQKLQASISDAGEKEGSSSSANGGRSNEGHTSSSRLLTWPLNYHPLSGPSSNLSESGKEYSSMLRHLWEALADQRHSEIHRCSGDRRKESGATGAVLVNPATDLAVICASRVREKLKKDQKPVRVDANPLLSSTMLCIKGMGWRLQQERRCRSEGQERAVKRHRPNLDCAGDVKDDTVGFCESVPWESLQREHPSLFGDRKLNSLGRSNISPFLLPSISTQQSSPSVVPSASAVGREALPKEEGYLCTGLDLYLVLPTKIGASDSADIGTDDSTVPQIGRIQEEPSPMDAMALVHSRIRRVIFATSPHTSEVKENCACWRNMRIHGIPSLNHHYKVFELQKSLEEKSDSHSKSQTGLEGDFERNLMGFWAAFDSKS